MDVGTQQGYHPDSPTHPESVKHYSRYRQSTTSQTGCSALKSSKPSWTTGHGSVCIQIDTSDIQLETRPPGVSSEYIPTGLGPTERLCQPTMVLNWQSYEPGTPPANPTGAGNTSVEGLNLVSSTTRDDVGLP